MQGWAGERGMGSLSRPEGAGIPPMDPSRGLPRKKKRKNPLIRRRIDGLLEGIMSVLVVGSIALDTVKTPVEEHADLLGGSASYAAVAVSFFSDSKLVGIVGKDFPEKEIEFFKGRNIDLEGLQIVDGETFRWSGEYMWDYNTRETKSVALNVFETFSPELPESYRNTDVVLLANIAPSLQLQVLDQVKGPKFVVADTMDLWIETTKDDLLKLIKRVDLLILNDSEARQLTGETSLIKAGRTIREMGSPYVAIKKGEHGCLLFGERNFFSCGAYPLEDIHDPTGAGDTFAGGLAGYLDTAENSDFGFEAIKKGVVRGSILASFNVEAFSLERMRSLTEEELEERYWSFKEMTHYEELEVRA